MKRVEKDPEGGWIARRKDGSIVPDASFRWNNRSAARDAAYQEEWLAGAPRRRRSCRPPTGAMMEG